METDVIVDEIKLAMRTLKNMPADGPARLKAAWPDVYHDSHEAYGWEPAKLNRFPPTPDEIKRMDKVLFEWLPKLTDYERVLVSARGAGMSWRKIMRVCRRLKSRSHEGHRQNWQAAIGKLQGLM
ncbi:hypothetical protein LCGC14_2084510 [marine sediment metagenome]|uniref:DUF6362 domain-containing protein n=1 Tax=marine sediment metagenome TaxID=412755 RepID=A0A0F9F1V4_9ZZZZ